MSRSRETKMEWLRKMWKSSLALFARRKVKKIKIDRKSSILIRCSWVVSQLLAHFIFIALFSHLLIQSNSLCTQCHVARCWWSLNHMKMLFRLWKQSQRPSLLFAEVACIKSVENHEKHSTDTFIDFPISYSLSELYFYIFYFANLNFLARALIERERSRKIPTAFFINVRLARSLILRNNNDFFHPHVNHLFLNPLT